MKKIKSYLIEQWSRQGRYSREMFLKAILQNIIFFIFIPCVISFFLIVLIEHIGMSGSFADLIIYILLWISVIFAIVVSCFQAQIKRVHDLGRTGKAIIFLFIPLFTPFYLSWAFFSRGVTGENKYGPDPLLKK